ncbi:asparaginase [Lagierella sp.]|uniref:asparaginase n=1 Tax=Lagierella sp. TaxID=2849657 RepID=UPI00261C71E7|nr:asparaginase [Lagierella sp.]
MEKLATTTRGQIEDLYTFGNVILVDENKTTVYEKGNGDEISFPRSSAKLMQALTPLSLGAKEKFNLSKEEIAIICASHSGEDFHIKTIRKLLKKTNLEESSLKCGPHYPFKEDVAERMKKEGISPLDIHNNCSGKHTGMLLACRIMGWSLEDYYKIDHPVQKLIIKNIERVCQCEIPLSHISVDGCGVPVHAMSMRDFAYGMARMADYENLEGFEGASKDIIEAITLNSKYTSGSDRIDHYLISRYPGKIIVKSGANGYFGGLLPDRKYGFAIKTYDGKGVMRNLILIELLKKLEVIPKKDYDYFDNLFTKEIKNHRNEIVGEVKLHL